MSDCCLYLLALFTLVQKQLAVYRICLVRKSKQQKRTALVERTRLKADYASHYDDSVRYLGQVAHLYGLLLYRLTAYQIGIFLLYGIFTCSADITIRLLIYRFRKHKLSTRVRDYTVYYAVAPYEHRIDLVLDIEIPEQIHRPCRIVEHELPVFHFEV